MSVNNEAPGHELNEDTAKRRPSRPRDAASLVIYHQREAHYEVLMGKRGQRARFKPGVYVFPGGVLERADFLAKPVRSLDGGLVPILAVGGSVSRADALTMAAVREAFEEAGLLYGDPGHVGSVSHPSWRAFREQELSPDLGDLEFLGRAITPTYRTLRYHARFFAVPYTRMHGSIGGDGELDDLRWMRTDRHAEIETTIICPNQDLI